MKFSKLPSSPDLSEVVAYFWTLRSTDQDSFDHIYRFVPDGYVDWIFHLKLPWLFRYHGGEGFEQHSCHLLGHASHHIDIRLKDDLELFGVKFHPWAARWLWQCEMNETTNKGFALDLVHGSWIRSLYDAILHTSCTQERIRLSEQRIRTQLKEPQNDLAPYIRSMQEFADDAGPSSISRRRLEQRFRSEVGISPGLFGKTMRINSAINSMITDPGASLTEVSYVNGFFDQSHFIRDFKRFTGLTPGQFQHHIEPDGEILNLRVAL